MRALERTDQARAACVYHSLTNLAVLGQDLLGAVQAQKEALRLEPEKSVYRHNLLPLLPLPYAQRTRLGRGTARVDRGGQG